MLTMPLWNIRNKLCEAATKLSLARNVEERHEFWCRNGDQGSKIGNYKCKISISIGCFKCYLYKDAINEICQFPQFMGVAINFIIFRSVPWDKLTLDFMWSPVLRVTGGQRVNVCVAYHTPVTARP